MLVNYVFTYISLLLQRPAFEKIRPNKDNTAEICAALDDDILEIKGETCPRFYSLVLTINLSLTSLT
jgi:hypothetical protein